MVRLVQRRRRRQRKCTYPKRFVASVKAADNEKGRASDEAHEEDGKKDEAAAEEGGVHCASGHHADQAGQEEDATDGAEEDVRADREDDATDGEFMVFPGGGEFRRPW